MQLHDPAYVISLHPNNAKRIVEKLARVGITAQHYQAQRPSFSRLKRFIRESEFCEWAGNRIMKHSGELGCLLSHAAVLSKVPPQGAFIFEDDILLRRDFRLPEYDGNWLYLGGNQRSWKGVEYTFPFYTARLTLGTFAYWVSAKYARILREKILTWAVPVDQYYARYAQERLVAHVCNPNLVICDVGKSSTGHGKRDLWKFAKKCRWILEDYELPF